ncbi:MAG: type II secretion system F family protein [Bacillota bacterium]
MRDTQVWSWCQQLEAAARAGLPLGQVLKRAEGQTTGRLWGRLLQGDTVAEALQACGVLSRWEATRLEQAVRAGEGAAVLKEMAGESLGRLTRRGDLRVSLVYPLFVLVLGGVVAVVTGLFFLPALLTSLQAVGPVAGFPPATRALLWVARRWHMCLGVLGATTVTLGLAVTGKLGWPGDGLSLALPGIGQALLWRERARLLESLGQVGLIGEEARVLARGCSNGYLRRRLALAVDGVERGLSPAQALVRTGVLPPHLATQVVAAEATGEAGPVCRELAAYCRRLQREYEKLSLAWLEPGLTLLAAGVVAMVALAVAQPLYLAISRLR